MKLFDHPLSGNCYKVRLLLAQLDLPCALERVEVAGAAAGERPEEFRARSPNGRIPLLLTDDGSAIGESNAILVYLARNTPFLAEDPLEQARTLQWMFFEQNQHEPSIATSRYWRTVASEPERVAPLLEAWRLKGEAALATMERHLGANEFFVAGRYGIADIALYAYTHVAPEGGFELEPFPAVRAWLDRVRAQPGHVPMTPAAPGTAPGG